MSKESYEKEGVFKGAIGTIIFSWIRNNKYEVVFSRPDGSEYVQILIHVRDLEVVKSSNMSDNDILEDLPKTTQIGGVR